MGSEANDISKHVEIETSKLKSSIRDAVINALAEYKAATGLEVTDISIYLEQMHAIGGSLHTVVDVGATIKA